MFVHLFIIEALPGGTCSLVLLKYWLVSMFHVLFISIFSDNFVPHQFGIFLFPRLRWLVQIHPYLWEGSLLRHTKNSSLNSTIKCSLQASYYRSLPSDDVLGIWQRRTEHWSQTLISFYWYFKLTTKHIGERVEWDERERQRER